MIRDYARHWWRHFGRRSAYAPATQALEDPAGLVSWVDAVIAIAATLLVLELRVPEHAAGGLGRALGKESQHYAAYALGYVVVVLGWLNTRRLLRFLRGVDYYLIVMIVVMNGAWTLTPFAVAALASAGSNTDDLASAVRLMTGIITGSMLLLAALTTYAGRRGLWQPELDDATRRLWVPGCQLIWVIPLTGFALSYLSAYAGLACTLLYVVSAAMPVPGVVGAAASEPASA